MGEIMERNNRRTVGPELEDRITATREDLSDFCKDILKKNLTPEQLETVQTMKGKNTAKYVHKGGNRVEQLHRNNPFSIKATKPLEKAAE